MYWDKEDLYLYRCLYLGGKDNDGTVYDEILQFNADTEEWSLAGHMVGARFVHAVSTIQFEVVREYCIMHYAPLPLKHLSI